MDIEIKISDDCFQAKHRLTDISCSSPELYNTFSYFKHMSSDSCTLSVIKIVWGHGLSAHITEKWPIDN